MNRLVIFAPNWLGDAVMALPALADVRRGAPGATITVAARPAIAPLFGLVREVDAVVVLERSVSPRAVAASWSDLGRELRGGQFDTAILLPNSFSSALIASRAGIPERWGYRNDCRAPLLTRAVRAPRGLHQVEYYQHLAHALGFANGPADDSGPRLAVSDGMRGSGVEALTAIGWDARTPLVALAPGAAYGGAKRWPPASFAALARSLGDDGVGTVMVGSAADAATGQEIEAAFGGRSPILNAIGRTNLPALAGVLVNCRALVTNDSGAMHLAAALSVRVTAVFGPTDERATAPLGMRTGRLKPAPTSEETVRLKPDTTYEGVQAGGVLDSRGVRLQPDRSDPQPDHSSVTVLTHPVWCRPCMLRECPLDHRCMRGVTVDHVLDATRPIL